MNEKKRVGDYGEQLAARYLTERRYLVQEFNYRTSAGEIDIIAYDGSELVFVEVKTRRGLAYGRAAQAVDRRKQLRLITAARQYLTRFAGTPPACRFDVIEVYLLPEASSVNHIKNAFMV